MTATLNEAITLGNNLGGITISAKLVDQPSAVFETSVVSSTSNKLDSLVVCPDLTLEVAFPLNCELVRQLFQRAQMYLAFLMRMVTVVFLMYFLYMVRMSD